jgi:hypothetical protein
MPLHEPLDDATADAVLSGRLPTTDRDDVVDLASFVIAVRSSMSCPSRPNLELAHLLEHGPRGPRPDRSVGVDSAAHAGRGTSPRRIAPSAEGLRGVRRRAATKLAAFGLAARVAAGSAAVLVAATGVGAVGALPETVQARLDTITSPASSISSGTDEVDVRSSEDEPVNDEVAGDERPGIDGQVVAEDASDPDEPAVDGREVANETSDGHSEEGGARAEDKHGDRAATADGRRPEDATDHDERRPGHATQRAGERRPDHGGPAGEPGAQGRSTAGEPPPAEGEEEEEEDEGDGEGNREELPEQADDEAPGPGARP